MLSTPLLAASLGVWVSQSTTMMENFGCTIYPALARNAGFLKARLFLDTSPEINCCLIRRVLIDGLFPEGPAKADQARHPPIEPFHWLNRRGRFKRILQVGKHEVWLCRGVTQQLG